MQECYTLGEEGKINPRRKLGCFCFYLPALNKFDFRSQSFWCQEISSAFYNSFQSGWDPLETEAAETSVSCGPHFLEQKARERESCLNTSHSHQLNTSLWILSE